MAIRVAIVEDNDEVREGLPVLVNGSLDFWCAATYADREIALKDLPAHKPDAVLMDIQLPGMSGIECVRELRSKLASMQTMMLTVCEDDERVCESLVAGASWTKITPPSGISAAFIVRVPGTTGHASMAQDSPAVCTPTGCRLAWMFRRAACS